MNSHLIIVRRRSDGTGGAEKFLRRLASLLSNHFEVDLWHAGTVTPAGHISETKGPSWYRDLAFSRRVRFLLPQYPQSLVLSFQRGVPGHLYRLGDGIHCQWMKYKYQRRPFAKNINLLNWVYPRLEKISVTRSKRLVVNSPMVLRELETTYPSTSNRACCIENGFDPATYRPDPSPNPRSGPLLFVGNGWARKGLDRAIQTLALLPHSHLEVYGTGKPRPYKYLAQQLNLSDRVQFCGSLGEMVAAYTNASALILPTRYDPFSNACLESLACGTPVITTPKNGIAHRLKPHQNGWVLGQHGDDPAFRRWYQETLPRLTPSGVAATVQDLRADLETQRWRDLLLECVSSSATANLHCPDEELLPWMLG